MQILRNLSVLLSSLLLTSCSSVNLSAIPSSSFIPFMGKPDKPEEQLTKDHCLIYDDELSSFVVPSPPSIWVRVRNGFQIPEQDKNNKLIAERLAWQAKHPKHFAEVTKRSKTYLYFILEKLDQHNMPYEIAMIPIIESGFNPFAHSSQSAVGMWQLMPATGKNLGLSENFWYDGRRDLNASTDAALNYLAKLHNMFNNDWLLAIAAYNSGEGTVSRAIKRNQSMGKPTDYWSLKLPKSTQEYIPKVLALKRIIQHPEQYNASLPSVADTPQFAVADIGSQIDLAHAARLAEIDIKEMSRLNPGYRQWATAPQGPHLIAVPTTKYDTFIGAINAVPKENRVSWDNYTIKNGDSLESIAQKFNTRAALLKDINQLSSANIRVGNNLRIPKSGRTSPYIDLINTQIKNGKGFDTNNTVKYTIASGDSLWAIAKRFKVSTKDLARWNNLNTQTPIKPGKTLTIKK